MMRSSTTKLFFLAAALAIASPAFANPYDDCILQYMGNAQNRDAIDNIQVACISKTSVSIPEDQVEKITVLAWAGKYSIGGIEAKNGLLIKLTNNTDYAITAIKVSVEDKKTRKTTVHAVDRFLAPFYGPGWISRYGEPRFNQIIQPGQTSEFVVWMPEVPDSVTTFPFSSWNVTPVKGIPQ
jgi:hypothetical protein